MKTIKNAIKLIFSVILIGVNIVGIIKYNDIGPVVTFLLINIIAYFIIAIWEILKDRELKYDNLKIQELKGGNERLQNIYDSIRCFRHDFSNIMQAMGGYIQTEDLDGLNDMYKSIMKECQDINNIQAINQDVINNPAIYNLINNKYQLCKKFDIKIKVEVLISLKNLKVKDLDLCRILGILIDNAIEAAKECEEKIVIIKFVHDNLNNRDLVIVENSFKNYAIDIDRIYEKGYSSKKEKLNHGLGLWKVNQIIRKNKNLGLYTTDGKLFRQQLEIYN